MSASVDVKAIAVALGVSRQACDKRANKEAWEFVEQTGRGGKKRLYQLANLPKNIREAILHHNVKSTQSNEVATIFHGDIAIVKTNTVLMPSHELKDWQRKAAEARSAIINEIKRLSGAAGTEKAIQAVIALAANGELPEQLQRLVPVANVKAGKDGKRTLSRTSIFRWMREAEQGFSALAPKNNAEMKVPVWAPPLLALYQHPQKPTLKKCLDDLMLPEGISAPSYWAAQRFLDKMSKLDLERGRMLPRELKNVRAFVRRDTSQMWPGDAYTADGHTFDAEIAHPKHGKPFRPEITSVLDIATRKCTGWSIDLAESTWSVLDALRCSVETCGIPSIFYVDNGSGFKNELMSDEATGFMARLGISITHSLPYNSQARGIIERSHQTLWVTGAKELPTYMGAAMDREAKQAAFKITRKDINAVGTSRLLMPWHEFVRWCKATVDAYNNRPHRSLPKIADPVTSKTRHQTPNEAWAAAMADGWEPMMLAENEAADLFRPYKIGKTHRAEVRLFGNIYFNKALEHYHGEQVRIGYDIRDAGRVWVRDMEGRMICVAEFEANKTAYFPVSQQQAADEKRAAGRIKRAQAKIDEAEEELNPPLVIEHQAAVTVPVFEFKAMPEQVWGSIYLLSVISGAWPSVVFGSRYNVSPVRSMGGYNELDLHRGVHAAGMREPSFEEWLMMADGAPQGVDATNDTAWTMTTNTGPCNTGFVQKSVSCANFADTVGNLWERVNHHFDLGGTFVWDATVVNSGQDTAQARGQVIHAAWRYALVGGYWVHGILAGARCLNLNASAWDATGNVGVRGVSDSL